MTVVSIQIDFLGGGSNFYRVDSHIHTKRYSHPGIFLLGGAAIASMIASLATLGINATADWQLHYRPSVYARGLR